MPPQALSRCPKFAELYARANFDRFAALASLFPPPAALRRRPIRIQRSDVRGQNAPFAPSDEGDSPRCGEMSAQRTKGTAPVRGWRAECNEARLGERKNRRSYLILSLPPAFACGKTHLPRQREERWKLTFGFITAGVCVLAGLCSGGHGVPPLRLLGFYFHHS